MKLVPIILILSLVSVLQPAQTTSKPIFIYHSGFWLSLHQYLYVLGRVEAKMPDIQRRAVAGAPDDEAKGLAQVSETDRKIWREVVHAYSAELSRLDAVFDDKLIVAGQKLARAGNAETLEGSGVDQDLRNLLNRAAPIYRRTWWMAHQAANFSRMTELDALVQKHGRAIVAYLTRAYEQPWPSGGYPVQFTPFSNWAGAFSTRDRHLVFSSMDPGLREAFGLEILFHEAMHQWDDTTVDKYMTATARSLHKEVPANLSHAMIFYTAGEAVRSVIPGHQTYAEMRGMWSTVYVEFKSRLDTIWKPYLLGQRRLDDVLPDLLN